MEDTLVAEYYKIKNRKIIMKNEILNTTDVRFYELALNKAAAHGNIGLIRHILKMGISANAQDEHGNTPLIHASAHNHLVVLRELLNTENILVNMMANNGVTALLVAASRGYTDVVKQLTAAPGIDINAQDEDNATALIVAIKTSYYDIALQFLIMGSLDVEVKDVCGRTALMYAAAKGWLTIVRQLVFLHGAEVNARDAYGNNALMLAADNGHSEVVKELLSLKGILVNEQEGNGLTALMLAAKGSTNVVRLLLEAPGINLHAKEQDGYTALMVASQHGSVAIVSMLVNRLTEPEISYCNIKGVDAFAVATEDVAKYLICSGRALSVKDRGSPFSAAIRLQHLLHSVPIWLRGNGGYDFYVRFYNTVVSLASMGSEGVGFLRRMGLLAAGICEKIPMVTSVNAFADFPYRGMMLVAAMYGIVFPDDAIARYGGISIRCFKEAAVLMKFAKRELLARGSNYYIFMHALLLRREKGVIFSKLSNDLNLHLLGFLVEGDLGADLISTSKPNLAPLSIVSENGEVSEGGELIRPFL